MIFSLISAMVKRQGLIGMYTRGWLVIAFLTDVDIGPGLIVLFTLDENVGVDASVFDTCLSHFVIESEPDVG